MKKYQSRELKKRKLEKTQAGRNKMKTENLKRKKNEITKNQRVKFQNKELQKRKLEKAGAEKKNMRTENLNEEKKMGMKKTERLKFQNRELQNRKLEKKKQLNHQKSKSKVSEQGTPEEKT